MLVTLLVLVVSDFKEKGLCWLTVPQLFLLQQEGMLVTAAPAEAAAVRMVQAWRQAGQARARNNLQSPSS